MLQAVIEAGEVGEPVSAVLQSRDPDAPPFEYVKGGGGLFKDMGEKIIFPDRMAIARTLCVGCFCKTIAELARSDQRSYIDHT